MVMIYAGQLKLQSVLWSTHKESQWIWHLSAVVSVAAALFTFVSAMVSWVHACLSYTR